MIVSKINFTIERQECGALQAFLEHFTPHFRANTLCREISIFQTGIDTVTSLTVYDNQKNANSAIKKLYEIFQAIGPWLKILPQREYVTMDEFQHYSVDSLLFHKKFERVEFEIGTLN